MEPRARGVPLLLWEREHQRMRGRQSWEAEVQQSKEKTGTLEVGNLGSNPSMGPWGSHLISLGLSFLSCKMG